MMYSEKLVTCIKINGKVVREEKDTVYIPFGSDYSIYFRNLHTQTCKISITIDGDDVLNGKSILLDAKKSMDLNGFLEGSNVKNKFRFIEKTNQISEYRGDNPEDGLIVISYSFNSPPVISSSFKWYDTNNKWQSPDTTNDLTPPICNNTCYSVDFSCNNNVENYSCDVRNSFSQSNNENGITVKGQETHQQFRNDNSIYYWDNEKTMIIHLKGDIGQLKVNKVVTTNKKIKCETCGTKNKSNDNYCRKCGTYLTKY